MLNSIFMLSKYLKKTVTTALILGLMISPILPATQSISSSISIASQAAEIEVQLEEAQASTGYWSDYTDTAWYYNNPDESTYTIATAEELAGLAQLVNHGTCNFEGKTIKLTDNIDLGNHEWVPIGVNKYMPFKGNFDGQKHTISNMHIGTSEAPANYQYAGLFGSVKADKNANNVTIANVNIGENSWVYTSTTNNDVYAGGICALANASDESRSYASAESRSYDSADTAKTSTLTISNCSNSANIEIYSTDDSKAYAGGICAFAIASASAGISKVSTLTISNCSNSANISSISDIEDNGVYAGGICAFASARSRRSVSAITTISNCSNSANIDAYGSDDSKAYAGGICGDSKNLTISNCSNSADIYSTSDDEDNKAYAGGICGDSKNLTINNCYYKEGTATRGIADKVDQAGQTTALPESQMTAATGTMDEDWVDITIDGDDKGKMALVDALNNYVDNNLNDDLLNWIQDDNVNDGYPTIVTNNNNAN